MLATNSSDVIRELVSERYIRPAIEAGQKQISVKVRDVSGELERNGFPAGRTPMVCQVLQGKKLLDQNQLEIVRVDGPPSKQSPTVIVHYRVLSTGGDGSRVGPVQAESPADRAFRLTERLRGLLKNEIAAFGGTEAFMKWVRSDEDEQPG